MPTTSPIAAADQAKAMKERLWQMVQAKRRDLEAAQGGGAPDAGEVSRLTQEYTSLQVAHNKATLAMQASSERAAITQLEARHSDPQVHRTCFDTRDQAAQETWEEVTSGMSGDDIAGAGPKALMAKVSANHGADTAALRHGIRRLWHQKHSPTTPELPHLPHAEGCTPLPYTVFGEGVNFLSIVDRTRWEVVPTPQEATLIWERDALESFRRDSFDPRVQAINRMHTKSELAFADKAELCRDLQKPENAAFAEHVCLPETVLLTTPTEFLQFAQSLGKEARFGSTWILKRANLASGFGITVLESCRGYFSNRQKLQELMANMQHRRHRYVLQRYIKNPLLLKLGGDGVGRKFDLRCYFLVASVDPLVVFWADGVARLNIEEYREGLYDNPHIHISNIAQQRTHRDFAKLQNALKMNAEGLRDRIGGDAFASITARMQRAIRSVILCKRSALRENAGHSRFQLMAADFLIDADLTPHLLEVQTGCALSCDDPVSAGHIPKLVNATLQTAYDVLSRRANGESLQGLPARGILSKFLNEA